MIPKIIHYFWFGENELPEQVKKCIASWEKYCPDYEIVQWNEQNYDINKNEYMRQAYENKKWGFVPDYARLDVIYEYGGIYFDTDVELIKSFDNLLDQKGFCGIERDTKYINLGSGFGACKNNETIKAIRDNYDELEFIKDGVLNLTPSPRINTNALKKIGYQFSEGIFQCGDLTIYPWEYFCPQSYETGEISLSEETYSIHHFSASWHDSKQALAHRLRKKFIKFLPKTFSGYMAQAIATLRYEGITETIHKIVKKIKINNK